ncbi:MAG: hypothetical protein KDE15_03350 [Erythrobacter sp.]|nr:hypothetical protein [Erythrobacter sp.]
MADGNFSVRSGQTGWPHLIFAVLLVQLVYWVLIAPNFYQPLRPYDQIATTSVEVAPLDAPSWQAVEAAQFTPVDLPWRQCCQGGYYAVRFTFDLDRVPQAGLGESADLFVNNYTSWLNGSQFAGQGEMELPRTSFHGRVFRGVHRLPAAMLRQGRNELVYVMASAQGAEGFTVFEPVLGSYDSVSQALQFRIWLLTDYIHASIAIGFAIGVVALLVWARSRQGEYLFWMGVLAASWAGALLMMSMPDPPVTGALWLFLGVPVSLMIPVAGVNMGNSWGPRRLPHLRTASLVAYALGLAWHAYAVFVDPAHTRGLEVIYVLVVVLATVFAGLIVWNIPVIGRDRHWEAAVYLLLFAIVVHTGAGIVFDLDLGRQTNYAIPVLLVALVTAFVARNIRLFASAEDFNAQLQVQLGQREAELAVAHQREKALLREQAHQDERRRIMADMHDGLGSQLMGMLLSARRGKAEPEVMARGLQGAIDEMRLLIDSMDSVGESLSSALALFHERAQDRVTAAGYAFEWRDRSGGQLPALPPRAVLQVFRVLQESVTNALKHSNGSLVRINVASRAIEVCDNGTLLGDERPGGRGLENMVARASAIGGSFALVREGDLTVARIVLPEKEEGATHDG